MQVRTKVRRAHAVEAIAIGPVAGETSVDPALESLARARFTWGGQSRERRWSGLGPESSTST